MAAMIAAPKLVVASGKVASDTVLKGLAEYPLPSEKGSNTLEEYTTEKPQLGNLGGKATVYTAQPPAGSEPQGQNPTVGQQLIDLQKAKDAGAITDAEYQTQKAKLLGNK